MSLFSRIFTRSHKTSLLLVLLFALPVMSCVSKTTLINERDDTPPDVSVTVNGTELTDRENVTKFDNMQISGIIRLHGTAVDEQSGVRDISVGANLELQCGVNDGIMFHATGDRPEWHPEETYSGSDVAKKHTTTYNFRLWYLQQRCGEDPLIKAEGDIFVTARNYFGQTTTKSYKVEFTPSNWN